jgi:hypothetical protein
MIIPSDEQMQIINNIKSGYNGNVDAVAGSGKTTTVLSLSHHNNTKHIIQVTYNSELKREVNEKKIKYSEIMFLDKLSIYTYHSLAFKYYSEDAKTDMGIYKIVNENLPPKCKLPIIDILVCDEIQDMNDLYYQFIHKVLRDIHKQVQILILGDKYQGLYEFKGADTRYLTLGTNLWDCSPYEFKNMNLNTSYRVTKQIAQFVNKVMLGEERIHAIKDGPKVLYIKRQDCFQVFKTIGRKIISMIESGYAKPDDIFVLTASVKSKFFKKIENMLVENNIPCYVPMSENSAITNDVVKNKVIFSSFHQSKGRERKVTVVYGFDKSYFDFYSRDVPTHICPSTLYVAATRATETLIVIESSETLPFLKYNHSELCNCDFVEFEGVPLGLDSNDIFNSPPNSPDNIGTIHKTSPTDLIKFLNENTLIQIAKIMEDHLYITDELSYPLNIVNNENYTHSNYHGVQLAEEVFDINGLVIPSLYEERNSEHKTNTIKEYVKHKMKSSSPFYKSKVSNIDFKNTTLEDQLLLTNIYKSLREQLLFKVAQIQNYTWLSQTNIDSIFLNMDKHIEDPTKLKYEFTIISNQFHTKKEKEHETQIYSLIDEFIETHMGVNFGKIRFEAIVDALSDTTIWEFKCVEEITPEHRLQLLIYAWLWKMTHTQETKIFKLMNIRTGEVQTLDAYSSLLDDIILLIIRAKFQKLIVKTDEEFIENCKQLISHSSDEVEVEVEDSETDDDDPNDSDYVYEGTDDEDDLEFMRF